MPVLESRNQWLAAASVLALAVGMTALGCILRVPTRHEETSDSIAKIEGLAVANADLQLGEVWEDNDFRHSFEVRNISLSEVEIEDLECSCVCSSIRPRQFRLGPSETIRLEASLDLTHRTHRELHVASRRFAVDIRPIQKRKKVPSARWRLEGTVNSRITLSELDIQFGEEPIVGRTTRPRTVIVRVHVPFQSIEVQSRSAEVTVRTRPLAEPGQYELSIVPRTDLVPGNFRTMLEVQVVGNEGDRQRGPTLPVSGTVRSDIRILPASVYLPNTPVGETAESTLVLEEPPNSALVIESIATSSADLAVKHLPDRDADGRKHFLLMQKITRAGDERNTIRFTIRRPGSRSETITVTILARGEQTTASKQVTP